MYFVPSERALPDLDLHNPAGLLKLASEPLRRLFVMDQAETVRVLALDWASCLHHCYWRRPGAGHLPGQETAEEMGWRYMVFASD